MSSWGNSWAEEKEKAGDWALGHSVDGSQSGYCKEWELGEDLGEPAHSNGIDFLSIMIAFKVE